MKTVKFYGGPMHGKTWTVEDGQFRLEAVETLGQRVSFRDRPIDYQRPSPTLEHRTYHIKRYAESWSHTIVREIEVAVLEGADLFPRERHELDRDLQKSEWFITHRVSMLKDFSEWWTQTILEFTGRLTDRYGCMIPRSQPDWFMSKPGHKRDPKVPYVEPWTFINPEYRERWGRWLEKERKR
jgi:hypothetical protein